jgi:uncharacterized membrane protein YphA (DoxX/SURF4 family)
MIGAVALIAAIPKLTDIEKNSVELVRSYNIFPAQPVDIALFLGLAAPYLELLLGLCLVLGVFTRLAAGAWGILSLAYFLIKLNLIFIQGEIVPCGCFAGLLPNLLVTQSIWIDIITLPLCTQIILANSQSRYFSLWPLLPERWRQSRLRRIW